MPSTSGKNSSFGSGGNYTFRSTPTGSGNWNTGGSITGTGNIGDGRGSSGITPYGGNIMSGMVSPAASAIAPVVAPIAPVAAPVAPIVRKRTNRQSPVISQAPPRQIQPSNISISDLLKGGYGQYQQAPNRYTNINQPQQPTRPVYTPQQYTNQTRPWNPQQPTYTPSSISKDQSRIAPTFTKDQSRLPQSLESNRSFRVRHNSGGGLGGGGGSGW